MILTVFSGIILAYENGYSFVHINILQVRDEFI